MYDDIRYAVDDGIATITIDRPDVMNAFRAQTLMELGNALECYREDETAYVGILTGSESGFCAGADATPMPDWKDTFKTEYSAFLRSVQQVVCHLRESEKPTVAAVAGPTIGAECDFALACDVRFVDSDAILREGFSTSVSSPATAERGCCRG